MVRGVCVEEFQRVEGERYAMEAQLLQEQAAHLATQADLGTVQGELAEAQARGGDLEGTSQALETSLHQERAQAAQGRRLLALAPVCWRWLLLTGQGQAREARGWVAGWAREVREVRAAAQRGREMRRGALRPPAPAPAPNWDAPVF